MTEKRPRGRPRKITDDQAEWWAEMYVQGYSTPDLAKMSGVSITTVRSYLIKQGVTLQPPGAPPKGSKYYEVRQLMGETE